MLRTSLDARLLLAVTALALGACDDDEGPDPVPLDAQVDSGQPDAKVDMDARTDAKADSSVDASTECTLDQAYVFTWDGGLMAFRDKWMVSPAGKLTITRTAEAVDPDAGVLASCQTDLPACGSDKVDLSVVARALHAPGVIAAFGDGTAVFGCDSRPMDGPVLEIRRADGKKILLGRATGDQTGCTAVPADVGALSTVVNELQRLFTIGTLEDGGNPDRCILKSR